MLQTRLREIRKKQKLTLEDVAKRCRPPTTAQTIGRLETGMRTVSVKWIERIAKALKVDPQELIGLPEGGDIKILAKMDKSGDLNRIEELFSLRLEIENPIAIKIEDNTSGFIDGDILVCSNLLPTRFREGVGQDCFLQENEQMVFGKLLSYDGEKAEVAAQRGSKTEIITTSPTEIAPYKFLIRAL